MSSRSNKSRSKSNQHTSPKSPSRQQQPPPPTPPPTITQNESPTSSTASTLPQDPRYQPRVSKLAKQAKVQRDAALARLTQKHPLQRIPSPSPGISGLIHFLGLCSFGYSFKWLLDNPNPISSAYGWHFQYLTIIGLTLGLLTYLFGFIADWTESRFFFGLKNVFSMCSTPLEVLISLLYFGIRAIDPELVVPKDFELPVLVDLSMHLAPAAFLFFDLLFFSPPWTITVLPAVGLSAVLAFAYWFWIEWCYTKNGFYPYPMFALMDTNGRIALFGASAVLMALNTLALKWVYTRFNGVGTEVPGRLKKAS